MPNPCEKSCETCLSRESCPGCGQIRLEATCPIGSCCQEKGHETCGTCSKRVWCPTHREAYSMPKRRAEEKAAQEDRMLLLQKQAPVMVKWLKPLFWVMVAGTVLDNIFALFGDSMEQTVPALVKLTILTLLYGAEAFCKGKLSSIHPRYRTAAVMQGTYVLVQFATTLLGLWWEQVIVQLLLSIVVLVLSLLSMYHFLEANGSAVLLADHEMADKWNHLWGRVMKAYAGILVSTVLSVIIPLVGALLLLVSSIALLVFSVQEYIYIWDTIHVYKQILE